VYTSKYIVNYDDIGLSHLKENWSNIYLFVNIINLLNVIFEIQKSNVFL